MVVDKKSPWVARSEQWCVEDVAHREFYMDAKTRYPGAMPNASSRALWNDWYNAELYAGFTREYPVYGVLNRRLVETARIESAHRVLDLACGTGATALACLRRLPRDGELLGVDAAEAMVEVARAQVLDPRARFLVADAATVESALVPFGASFDRVVCNTAFWQLPDPASVLRSVGRLSETGALFAFNVPADRVEGEASTIHAFQIALAREVESRTDRLYAQRVVRFDPDELDAWIAAAGFALVERELFRYVARQEELTELMKIPAMIGSVAPGLSPEHRQEAIESAEGRVDQDATVEVPWLYYLLRRI